MATESPILIDPPIVELPASGGTSVHQIINASDLRLAFKVKSSNNTHYQLKPVFGFINPGGSHPLVITRKSGPPKSDKLVIQCKQAPPGTTDAAGLFKEGNPLGEVIIPMTAQ